MLIQTEVTMNWLLIVAGAGLLILGRRMFWIFVGLMGFFLGMTIAPEVIHGLSQTATLVIAVIIGLLGALLAVLVQKIAIGLAGFAAGGYLVYFLINSMSANIGTFLWPAIIVGGILGAILAASMFGWALVILSSGIGAAIITENLKVSQPLSLVLLISLFVLGIILQSRIKV
jgi:hypothetical protein